MVPDIKEKYLIIWRMEKVNYIIKMEDFMTDNGKIIWCTVKVNYIIKVEKLLIKEIGENKNLRVGESFIIKIPNK
jgi:hypothetical protein